MKNWIKFQLLEWLTCHNRRTVPLYFKLHSIDWRPFTRMTNNFHYQVRRFRPIHWWCLTTCWFRKEVEPIQIVLMSSTGQSIVWINTIRWGFRCKSFACWSSGWMLTIFNCSRQWRHTSWLIWRYRWHNFYISNAGFWNYCIVTVIEVRNCYIVLIFA